MKKKNSRSNHNHQNSEIRCLKITGAKKIREMFYQLKQEAVKEHGQMTDARFLELVLVNWWQDLENKMALLEEIKARGTQL